MNGNQEKLTILNKTDEPPPNICPNSGIKIPNRIFVGGIPYDCTSKELAQFFRHYGLVAKSKIIRDCDGISKGYGFITFSQNSDAHKVLKMGTVFFREKKLKIGPAIRRLANNDSLSIMNLQDEDDSTTFNWRNSSFSNQHLYLPSSYPAQALYSIHPGNPTFRSDVNFQNIHSVSSLICQPQINELSPVQLPPIILPDDFKAYSKIRVANHLFNREKFPSHYKFKEYCPLVFRKLREGFNIDDQAYARAFCVPPLQSISDGHSGAMLITSRNKRFLGKTMYKEEVELMHNILPNYYQYVVEKKSNTLLPHYVGMYRIRVENKVTYFLVMENVFGKRRIHRKYDLKGSTVDRQAKTKEKEKEKEKGLGKVKKHLTLKDQDFLADGVKLSIGEASKCDLMEKLKADTDFLARMNIMDYSLLVGIHEYGRDDEESEGEEVGMESPDESVEDLESPNDASGTAESAGDSPTSSPPGTPPATPPCTPPPTSHTPISRPPLRNRAFSQDSNDFLEDDLDHDFFAIACSEGIPKPEKYFVGIVDVLTYYGAKKRTAHAAKTVKHGVRNRHGAEISTIKPDNYAKRFLEFIEKALD